MDALSKEFRVGSPWEFLYADDLVLVAESEGELLEKIKLWKQGLEVKDLRVNMRKTKVMRCQSGVRQVKDTGRYPCSVCHKGVGKNSIECSSCKKWTQKKCSGIKGRLQKVVDYCCPSCASYGTEPVARQVDVVLDDSDRLESVDQFCYLGDMLGAGGRAEEATRNRVRCGWAKFR